MADGSANVKLKLAFENKKAKDQPVIYRGADASINQLTLNIQNVGSPIKLKGGDPKSENDRLQNGDGVSTFYLTFKDFLTAEQVQGLAVSLEGWKAQYFPKPMPSVAISPTRDIILESNQSLSFQINQLQTELQPGFFKLSVDYLNLGEVGEYGNFKQKVHVLNPPVPGNKDLVLNANFLNGSGRQINISTDPSRPIQNQLAFFLSNPDPNHPIVVRGNKVEGQFAFTFVFDEKGPESDGALTTAEDGKNIQLNLPNSFGNQWRTGKSVQGPSPVWFLTPQSTQLFGTGSSASLELMFNNIVTELQPGLTPMYLQYSGIPGFNDGFITFPLISKVLPKPSISFEALPSNIAFGEAVDLYWSGVEVSRVILEFEEIDAEGRRVNTSLDSNLGQIPLLSEGTKFYPKEKTTYTLQAYGTDGAQLGEIQREVSVTPPAPPEVSFSFVLATPFGRFVDDGEGKISCFNPTGPVKVQWSIKNALGASLSPSSSPLVEKAGEPGTFIGRETFAPEPGKDTFPNTTFTLTVRGFDSNQYPITHVETLHIYNVMANPIGSIIAYSGTGDPDPDKFTGAEWKICDGRALQVSEYPELHGFIGNSYGDGTQPGGNTAGLFFNLPDLRGQFLRGRDNGRGLDPDAGKRTAMQVGGNIGDSIGSVQGFMVESHQHNIEIGGDRTLWPSGQEGNTSGKTGQAAKDPTFLGNPDMKTDDCGGNETRPVNAYVSFIIRVK